ncbi:helix-turn-helix domain-containing protein [Marinifilum sp. D737]|uniref:helix-turn-helix domain-containing protein n=1 Tax=Marinifilum sp. D737 TaxID=2969628 RepID=UPI002275FF07|nr:helix-turn-helix domain-containing protein [Marinifilum sp. D737]MCY1635060.1 helix-turn-helix domain-containing protein [Marinifilum sp. D737]
MKGWTYISDKFFAESKASLPAKLLYSKLFSLANGASEISYPNSYFAKFMGKSEKSIKDYFKQLEEIGYLSRNINEKGKTVRKITLLFNIETMSFEKPGNPKKEDSSQYAEVIKLWNGIEDFKNITSLTLPQKEALTELFNNYSIKDFETVVDNINKSDFLRGHVNENWQASFGWVIKPENFKKILNGKYNQQKSDKHSHPHNHVVNGKKQLNKDDYEWR